jgi:predicted ester cyclase
MTVEANKAIVRRFVDEVRNQRREATIEEIVVPARWDEFKATLASLRTGFSDYHVTIERLIAEGDLVVLQAMQEGVHSGEYLGIPATGTRVRWAVNRTFRFEDGRIAETWALSDQLGLLRQLGLAPTHPPAPPAERRDDFDLPALDYPLPREC